MSKKPEEFTKKLKKTDKKQPKVKKKSTGHETEVHQKVERPLEKATSKPIIKTKMQTQEEPSSSLNLNTTNTPPMHLASRQSGWDVGTYESASRAQSSGQQSSFGAPQFDIRNFLNSQIFYNLLQTTASTTLTSTHATTNITTDSGNPLPASLPQLASGDTQPISNLNAPTWHNTQVNVQQDVIKVEVGANKQKVETIEKKTEKHDEQLLQMKKELEKTQKQMAEMQKKLKKMEQSFSDKSTKPDNSKSSAESTQEKSSKSSVSKLSKSSQSKDEEKEENNEKITKQASVLEIWKGKVDQNIQHYKKWQDEYEEKQDGQYKYHEQPSNQLITNTEILIGMLISEQFNDALLYLQHGHTFNWSHTDNQGNGAFAYTCIQKKIEIPVGFSSTLIIDGYKEDAIIEITQKIKQQHTLSKSERLNFKNSNTLRNCHDQIINQMLTDAEVDWSKQNYYGQIPLHLLVNSEEINNITRVAKATKNAINTPDVSGLSPLGQALINNNSPEIIGVIVANGGDINPKNQYGYTFLHIACSEQNKVLVEKAIALGANLQTGAGPNNNPPLHTMYNIVSQNHFSSDSHKISALFLQHDYKLHKNNAGNNEVFLTVLWDSETYEEVVKMSPASVHSTNQVGMTPIHFASLHGQRDHVWTLIEAKADINHYDSRGFSPLTMAVQNQDVMMVELLTKNGAQVNIHSSDYGNTPLHVAANNDLSNVNSTITIIQTLINKEAKVNEKNHLGLTPLHVAAHQGNKEVATTLLNNKADPNIQSTNGNTPVHAILFNDRITPASKLEWMKLLVNRGATLSHYNYKHESELAAAEVYLDSEGYHKVKELLGGLIDHYHDS